MKMVQHLLCLVPPGQGQDGGGEGGWDGGKGERCGEPNKDLPLMSMSYSPLPVNVSPYMANATLQMQLNEGF